MKPAIVFAILFVASVAGIVAGYSNFDQLLKVTNWERVLGAVPVLSTALVVTGGSLVVPLLAFWLCRGNRTTYNYAVLGYSYFAPFVVVLALLPGAQSKPDWAPLNHGTMLVVLCIAQVLATYSVRDWFWSKGRR